MDSPFWRRVAFGAIVCALVGLGVYLIGPAARGSGQSGSAASGRANQHAQSGSLAASASVSPGTGSVSTGSVSTGTGSTGTGPEGSGPEGSGSDGSGSDGQPDIYQWLPFTPAGLAAAASVVTRFGDAYGTYSYTESADAYAATLSPVTSADLTAQITAAYAAPGVATPRVSGKQVATGTATIDSISAFGPTSLTFAVHITQRIAAASGSSQTSTTYSVTLTGGGTNWQVTSIELASVGNS
jgi:hypothetical protein